MDPVTPAPVVAVDPTPVADPAPVADPVPAPDASWRDGLPDELKGSAALESIPDVNTLAKSFIDTKALVGANTVKMPAKTAEQTEWEAFYKAAGRPDEAAGYRLPTEGLPEGFKLTDEGDKQFRDLMHKSGLNEQQTAVLYRGYAEMTDVAGKQAVEASTAKQAENVQAIKDEYGTALDERVALNKQFIEHFDPDGEFKTFLNETGFGNDPKMFRFIDRMAKQMKEDDILGDGKKMSGRAPAEAQAEIGVLKADPEFMDAWLTKGAPGHKEAVERMDRLTRASDPAAAEAVIA